MTNETGPSGPHVLIIEARFYEDIADALVAGAMSALNEVGATVERVAVPGVFEVPAALALAIRASDEGRRYFDGYITLGCAIRGETSHYDIVANESARAIMDQAVHHHIAVGNGILTVENQAQARVRADQAGPNHGGRAAAACLHMIALEEYFAQDSIADLIEDPA